MSTVNGVDFDEVIDQALLARMRLRSVAIVTLQLAERIWRAIADVFSRAINSALGWSLL
ncbi:MAG: hypothetical protein AB2807_11100 [Candidatus Sedimenticola endophacoides]